ncbi:MAG: hypothetical protein VB861_17800 [Planctomycetaceae bacterium]
MSSSCTSRPIALVAVVLGLDARRLEIPGRKRLDIDYGKPILDIIA